MILINFVWWKESHMVATRCLFVCFFYFVWNLAWLILCNIFIHQKYLNGHLWTKSNVFVVVVFYMCNCKQQQQHGCKIIQNDFHILIRVVWRWIKQENKCIKSNIVVVVVRRKKDVCLSLCVCGCDDDHLNNDVIKV